MKWVFLLQAFSVMVLLFWMLWDEIQEELGKLPKEQQQLSNSHLWAGFVDSAMKYWPPSTVIILLVWAYKAYFK